MERALPRGRAADRRRHRRHLLRRHHRHRPLPGPARPEPGGFRPRGPPRALVGGDGVDHRGGDERGDLPGGARRGLHHPELRLRADHDRADPRARRGRPRLPAAVLHVQGLHRLRLPRGALRTVEQGLRLRPLPLHAHARLRHAALHPLAGDGAGVSPVRLGRPRRGRAGAGHHRRPLPGRDRHPHRGDLSLHRGGRDQGGDLDRRHPGLPDVRRRAGGDRHPARPRGRLSRVIQRCRSS